MTTTTSLTYAELCAGYGGLGMGVQAILGGVMLWCSEYDADPSRILAHWWPDVPNHGDLTAIDWAAMPRVDVMTAGFPCQPFSHAGKRLGANDERHLWPYIAQGIAIMRPQLVVLENVRGLMSGQGEPDTDEIVALDARITHLRRSLAVIARRRERAIREHKPAYVRRHTDDTHRLTRQLRRLLDRAGRLRRRLARAVATVLGDLADLGYDAQWYGLRAADVGAPHGRWRVFIFAWPAGAIDDPEWIIYRAAADAERRGCDGRTPHAVGRAVGRAAAAGSGETARRAPVKLLPSPRTSDTNGAGAHGDGGPDLRTVATLLPTPRATRGGSGTETMYGLGAERSDTNRPQGEVLLPTPTVSTHGDARRADSDGRTYSADGYERRTMADAVVAQDWREYEPAVHRWEALTRDAPPPTQPGTKGQPQLSPRFVEWMMGPPAGHVTDPAIWAGMTDSAARNAQLKALGNGVVPQQAAAATETFVADVWAECMAKAATA